MHMHMLCMYMSMQRQPRARATSVSALALVPGLKLTGAGGHLPKTMLVPFALGALPVREWSAKYRGWHY